MLGMKSKVVILLAEPYHSPIAECLGFLGPRRFVWVSRVDLSDRFREQDPPPEPVGAARGARVPVIDAAARFD